MWDDSNPTSNPAVTPVPSGPDSLEAIQTFLEDPHFKNFVDESYDSSEGYSIRINPVTGKKEMMIAGTRTIGQWALNAWDTALYGADKLLKPAINFGLGKAEDYVLDEFGLGPIAPFLPHPHIKGVHIFEHLDPWRLHKQKYYAGIAKEQGVEVIYGHSRGGAMVADMKLPPGIQKVGLDSAMLIAHHTGMLNINEGGGYNPLGLFDEAIGATGKNNVTFDGSNWSPHQVWAN